LLLEDSANVLQSRDIPEYCLSLNVNLSRYCQSQDIEVCGLKLESTFHKICILEAYRAFHGNFISFHSGLDSIMRYLSSSKKLCITNMTCFLVLMHNILKSSKDLVLVINCINWVLSTFNDNKLVINHLCISWKIILILFLNCIGLWLVIITLVSSVNRRISA
jgi:hypothetical protein